MGTACYVGLRPVTYIIHCPSTINGWRHASSLYYSCAPSPIESLFSFFNPHLIHTRHTDLSLCSRYCLGTVSLPPFGLVPQPGVHCASYFFRFFFLYKASYVPQSLWTRASNRASPTHFLAQVELTLAPSSATSLLEASRCYPSSLSPNWLVQIL